jgi:hypothetical protein
MKNKQKHKILHQMMVICLELSQEKTSKLIKLREAQLFRILKIHTTLRKLFRIPKLLIHLIATITIIKLKTTESKSQSAILESKSH